MAKLTYRNILEKLLDFPDEDLNQPATLVDNLGPSEQVFSIGKLVKAKEDSIDECNSLPIGRVYMESTRW